MKKKSILVTYSAQDIDRLPTKTPVAKLKAMGTRDIDFSDIPAIDMRFVKLVEKFMPQPKKPVTLRVDPEVLDWYQSQGKGYQTMMSAVLKAFTEIRK